MKRLPVFAVLIGLIAVATIGCERKLPAASRASAYQNAASEDSESMSLSAKKQVSLSRKGATEQSSTRELVKQITAATPASDLAVVSVLKRSDDLVSGHLVDDLALAPEALKNPAISRMVYDQYINERSKGRFWPAGVRLIGMSKNHAVAPDLFAEWQKMPPYVQPEMKSWGQMQEEMSLPKFVLAQTLFRIDNQDVVTSLLASFKLLSFGDKILVAKAANESPNPASPGQLVELAKQIQIPSVAGELVNSANRIIYHAIDGVPVSERAESLKRWSDVLAEMEKHGYVRDFLAKQIREIRAK